MIERNNMNKPWFNLDPNNINDRWWLYTSITDIKLASTIKADVDVLCHLIIQDEDSRGQFYRISTWYKNDPNRYVSIKYDYNWDFDKPLKEMKEGDIITYYYYIKFKVYDCISVSGPLKTDKCKILERMEDVN